MTRLWGDKMAAAQTTNIDPVVVVDGLIAGYDVATAHLKGNPLSVDAATVNMLAFQRSLGALDSAHAVDAGVSPFTRAALNPQCTSNQSNAALGG